MIHSYSRVLRSRGIGNAGVMLGHLGVPSWAGGILSDLDVCESTGNRCSPEWLRVLSVPSVPQVAY